MRLRPPRLARAILSAALPRDDRHIVLADLDTEYARYIHGERGAAGARLWYWRQVAGSILPALAMRRRRVRRAAPRASGASSVRPMLDQTAQDVRLALRSLRRRPGFAGAAIATFALGIGANTAIFSVVDGVLLKPLPYREPDRLIRIWSANPRGIPRNSVSPADFFDLQEQTRDAGVLESMAAFTSGDIMTLTGNGEPERLATSLVSPGLFDTLGVRVQRGRPLHASDAAGAAPLAVMISDRMWRSRYGSSERAVGEAVTLDGRTYTIAGIMPPRFDFPSRDVDAWIPMPDDMRTRSRSAHFLDVVGRLAPAASAAAAADALRTVAGRLAEAHPQSNRGWGVTVASLHESTVGSVRQPLLVLLAAVGCVLLIACANVASLLLARGSDRARDLAVRAALGASRGRIVRQQLTEAGLLALAGAAAGMGLAWAGLDMLRGGGGIELPRLHEVALDARVLTATGLLTLLTALLAGFAPAWRAARSDPEAALKGARAAGHATGTRRVRSALVAAEIALALALLVGAGLLVRSFARLTGVDAGFQADHVLLAQVSLVSSSYEPDRWASYVERAVSELASLPGVSVAGGGAPLPLSGQQGLLRFGVRIEGQPEPADGRTDRAYLRWATPGYFRAMGIPLIQGRTFEDGDRRDTLPVAVVDRAFVRRYFPGSDPIGRRLRMTNERVARQIVGVVGSVRQTTLEDEAEPHVYVAQAQNPSPVMTFVIRTEGEPRALAAAVRERIQSVDPTRPVYNVRTLEALVAGSVAVRRFNAVLLALFAGLAVSLALVGVYGVMAYWVGESAKEIGLRIALGATRGRILRHLLGRSLRVTLAGVAGGLLLSLVAGRFVGGLLFGVLPTDPVTLAASTAAVLVAAGAASYFPARRALAIDPADALRID